MNKINDTRFFHGGNATFTVSNGIEHYTYKIRKPNENTPFFVGLLTGPDNESSYTYMGLYLPDKNQVILTRKSRYTEDTKPFRVVNWALKIVEFQKELPEGYNIQHEGRCGRCGRTLTEPESIEAGFGPECREILGI